MTANKLNVQVACELSTRLYGAENWWVILEKDVAGAAAFAAALSGLEASTNFEKK